MSEYRCKAQDVDDMSREDLIAALKFCIKRMELHYEYSRATAIGKLELLKRGQR